MKVLISVEGQTEETFVYEVLQPHFEQRLYLQPVILKTRRIPGRPMDRGGYLPYATVKQEVRALLGDSSAAVVTTMYDLYALPQDFPGYDAIGTLSNGGQKVAHLEAALAADIGHPRLHPYIQPHEFEALLFSELEHIVRWMSGSDADTLALQRVRRAFANPEEIDDDPRTSPAHRIRAVFPTYQKEATGSLIAMDIGLQAICEACPHFAGWVRWLEGLG